MVVEGDSPGQIIKLEGTTTIGRDVSSCDVVLEDTRVSSYHARIELQDNQFVICDLASATGTYLNECDVGRTVLMDGDVIRIGHTTFVFKETMPEQGTEGGPEPKQEYFALVKARLPSKMYAGDACVINLQIVPTTEKAVSSPLDEGMVVSSLKFMTSEETPRVEAELLAVGLSVAGELRQVKPLRLRQPAICYWNISPPESGRFEMGFVFRIEAQPGQWEEAGMFTHQLMATKYDGLKKHQVQLLAGIFGGAAAVLGILEMLHKLEVLALFRR
jgi:hypothetical protein